MQDIEYERYKDWDFSKAKKTKHPAILELQARKQAYDQRQQHLLEFFDRDVIETIMQHDNEHDRERANTVLRALFA
ncbi:hypothetical protein AO372_0008 [Moraxella catarrhalis]|uniref:hypothetical protein n=1 Tax=Moraxella catarrhalis TaxID=480 RepID=UPI0007E4AD64|nr:hypothetical protein [Moraxella catarrhalis]OAV23405.1 hypothetical protein AO372_0008 [Moraxella catarrhalis]